MTKPAAALAAAALMLAAVAAAPPPPLVRLGSINWLSVYPGGDATGWGVPQAYAVAEINARSDLLPRTNLSLLWADPGRVPGKTIVHAIEMLNPTDGDPPVVGFIASVHSNNAEALSNYLSAIQKPQVAWSATAAELSDKSVHPYFSRNQVSAGSEARAIISFFGQVGWKGAAVVHGNDAYGRGTGDALAKYGQAAGVRMESFTVPWQIVTGAEEDARAALEAVLATDHRVIILHVTRWMSYPVLAMARELGMLNGKYQWILTSGGRALAARREPIGWPVGMVIFDPILPTDDYAPFASFKQGIEAFEPATVGRAWDSRGINAYDTVYVYAHALHELLEGDPAGAKDIHNGTLLLEAIRSVDFAGAMGRIVLDENGDGLVNIGVKVVVSCDDTGLETVDTFATVDGVTLASTVLYAPTWMHGGTATPLDGPPDEQLEVSAGLVAGAHALVALSLAVVVALAAMVHAYRDHAVIRASTPAFLQVILFGSALAVGSVSVAALGAETEGVCAAVPFMLSMACVLVVGPLVTKTWRLHLIFNGKKMQVKRITTGTLVRVVAGLAAFELAVHGARYGADRPEGVLSPVSGTPHTYVYKCQSDQPAVWWTLILLPKALLLVVGGHLAYKVRGLRSSFNESRSIAYSIYIVFFMSLLAIPVVTMSEEQPGMAFLVTTFAVIVGTLSLVGVLYGGKFWSILVTHAWKEQQQGTTCTSIGNNNNNSKPVSGTQSPTAHTSAGAGAAAAATKSGSNTPTASALQMSRIDTSKSKQQPSQGVPSVQPLRRPGASPSSEPNSPAPPAAGTVREA